MRYLSDMPEELNSHSLTTLLNHCKAQVSPEEREEIAQEAEVIFDLTTRIEAKTRRAAALTALRAWGRFGARGGPQGSKRMARALTECLDCKAPVPLEVRAWIATCGRECRGIPRGWAREWRLAVAELDGELGGC